MRLLEYEAKAILRNAHIPTPDGYTIETTTKHHVTHDLAFPLVVKSQVPIGGRGKLGGVLIVRNQTELQDATARIFPLDIKGYTPKMLLIEKAIDIYREFYVSLIINRRTASIDIVAHADGGMEVESQTGFFQKPIAGKNFDALGESLAEVYEIEDKSFLLADLVEKLYHCFVENDATLLEINPLVLTKQGNLVAGDCKMTLDDDAAFRHPDWAFEDTPVDTNFVTLNSHGTVATIANGAGLAMATVDAVAAAGLKPANFLDIGGGATVEGIVKSLETIVQFPAVNAIIINIFGGIVRCDDVAQAIIEASQRFRMLPKLYVRLSGTNSEQAAELLEHEGMTLYPDLAACVEEIRHG